MRAGPLSNAEVIDTLNGKFVNTWARLRELPELMDGVKGSGASLVATKLQQNYSDSVDTLVLSPDAEVITHQPEMALPYRNRKESYLSLLQRSLEEFKAKRQLNPKHQPINLGRKLKEVSHTFHAPGTNSPDYTNVEINTSSFNHDGTLYIKIHVGMGKASGRFELFDSSTDLTTNGSTEALTGTWNVPRVEPDTSFTASREGLSLSWWLQARSARRGARTHSMRAYTSCQKIASQKKRICLCSEPLRSVVFLYSWGLLVESSHSLFMVPKGMIWEDGF